VAQNSLMFDDYLKEKGITLENKVFEDSVAYMVREAVPDVGPVTITALFNNNDRIVTVICYQYLKLTAPQKKQAVLALINTLNTEYTMGKFTESGDALTMQIIVPFHDNFSPELIIEMISLMLEAIKEEHPRFTALL
jgi:Putative bacterial sensory transduction regulator